MGEVEELKNTNYTISEDYTLPSKGAIYSKSVNPRVSLKSMTTRDELKRTSPTNTPYKKMSEIIEGCMLEKPAIHVWDMCMGDYEYLLHKLRVVTYGPKYKMLVGCPHCNSDQEASADLDSLVTKEFDVDEFKKLQFLTLPVSQKNLSLRFQTPRMLDEIDIQSKEMAKRYAKESKEVKKDFTIVVSIMCAVDTVDGTKLTPQELEDFALNLPMRDSNAILNRLVKMNNMIGLDTRLEVKCPSCGGEILTFFRYGPEFFRPSED